MGGRPFGPFSVSPPISSFLDVYLPVQDGLDTILRVHNRQMPVKVLAISGHAVQGYDILKIAAIFGAHGTLENPSAWTGCCSESGRSLDRRTPMLRDAVCHFPRP
jgi:hypothetical protein